MSRSSVEHGKIGNAAILGGLFFASEVSPISAYGSEERPLAAATLQTAPSLGLRISGESPLPRETLEQEMSKSVGRTFVSDGAGTDGTIGLTFDRDPNTGVVHVRVQYEPPPEQLLRDEALPVDAAKITPRLANLVLSLLQQDAGVTIVTPPPPPMPVPSASSATDPGTDAAPPRAVAPPRVAESTVPSVHASTLGAAQGTPEHLRWRLSVGARGSLLSSAEASGRDASGSIDGDLSLVGASVQLFAPGTRRFRLGIEGVIDVVDGETPLGDGTTFSTSGVYAGLSAVGSLQLWSKREFAVNLLGHVGLIRTAQLEFSGFTATPQDTAADLGSRTGLALDVSYWLSDHLALTGQLGADRIFVPVSAIESEPGEAGARDLVRQDMNLRFTLPHLRLGASYRF